ncbi:DUF1129 domain-containing protein [Convivina praedatoris]|uniref:DUF1129 family protein n=1 Tax=Convivina praedatoris TaxID=2880963 RepID=A0ABM9D1A2_9LACO|nr:hypothetical protein [Convivina sp. LMG 32447]CAH1851585.1 hypothetical protein R077815_00351 [Convivina sp. LMG 32447]CAH1853635.1 hypothetical protein LMG032447_00683 [Convivina sp. LMG 32447]CAH1854415.1 hypothetical protein R078138_00879 [Convivina sp. LMG 32447]
MNVNDMIQSNNFLREKLNQNNKRYYENLLMYVRLSSWHHDEQAIESYLLSVLQDILDAQNDGQSAEKYFGKDPKRLADEYLQQLPNSGRTAIKMIGTIVLGYILFSMLPALVIPTKGIDFGTLIFSSLYMLLVIWFGFKYLAGTIYGMRQVINNRILNFALMWLASCLLVLPLMLIILFVKTPLIIKLTGWIGIIIILLLMAILIIYSHFAGYKKMGRPVILFSLELTLLGILTRLPVVGSYLTETKPGKNILAGLLAIFLVIFWIVTVVIIKSSENKGE